MSTIQKPIDREPVDVHLLTSFAEAQDDQESDLIVELIDLYQADSARRVADIRQALTTSDELSLVRAAHSLKGSSATLGAWQVAESCEELERLAPGLEFEMALKVLERLESELKTVRHIFTTVRQERTALW